MSTIALSLSQFGSGSGSSGYSPFADVQANPVLAPAGSETLAGYGSVVKVGSTYHMYYMYYISSLGQIGHATSTDGQTWTKDTTNNPVLAPSTSTAWDSLQVGVPTVWIEGSTWYMLYRGNSNSGPNAGNYRVGLATSSDGVTWTRVPFNNATGTSGNGCVMDMGYLNGGTESIDPYGIIQVGSTYYLYYSLITSANRGVAVATSTDRINWTKDTNNPLFAGGRYCVFPFKFGSYYYLIVPHYLGEINGDTAVSGLELYRDSSPLFYPSTRTFLGYIKQGFGPVGPGSTTSGTANSGFGMDTPFILTDDITRSTFNGSGGDIWLYYSGNADSPHTNVFTNLAISAQLGNNSAWPQQPLGVSEGGLYTTGPITSFSSDIQSGGPNGFWLTNANAFLLWTGRSNISSPTNGNVCLKNQAGTSFGLLQLGGVTNSFGALKLVGAGLSARLADDSADTTLTTIGVIHSDFGSAPTSAGTAGTAGQVVAHGGFLYYCSVTGAAGAATWNKLNMTVV